MLRWANENLLQLKPEEIGEHYGRYRLHVPEAERAMAKSLERYGQLSPVVVCRRGERYELIDGFKRLAAARRLAQIDVLSARLMEADERTVKAAIYSDAVTADQQKMNASDTKLTKDIRKSIMADKSLPYEVLKKVMATCTDADYGRISLAVLQKEKPFVAAQAPGN